MARWRRALVTGASSGIGEAIARRLAADGVDLVLVARRADRLQSLGDALKSPVCNVEIVVADLADGDDLERVAGRLGDTDAPVDLLVNNAGVGSYGVFWELPYEDAAVQVDVNVTALLRLTHAAVGRMVREGRGAVLNVSSISGVQPGPQQAVYAATKAFVTNFTEGLAEELRGSGVTATAVCPGLTHTEFHDVAHARDRVAGLPGFVWMDADTVAAEALEAAVKGKVVHVNGVANKVVAGLSGVTPRALRRRGAAFVLNRRG